MLQTSLFGIHNAGEKLAVYAFHISLFQSILEEDLTNYNQYN